MADDEVADFNFSCRAEFTRDVAPRGENQYAVNFRYFCIVNGEKTEPKDYTIVIKLQLNNPVKWGERLYNPLGVNVIEYIVESGNSDPLDFK